jgi:microcystin-dependent protein
MGTTAPAENLQVQSGNNTQLSLVSGALTTAELWFGHSANHQRGGILYNNVNNSMSFWTGTVADRMFINSSGNVGIGTSSPSSRLHVAGSLRIVDGTEGLNRVLTSDALGNASWQPAGGATWGLTGNASTSPGTNFIGTTDGQDLVFKTNNTEGMRLGSNGNFGIGTSPSLSKLNIYQQYTGSTTHLMQVNTFDNYGSTSGGISTAAYLNHNFYGTNGAQIVAGAVNRLNLSGNNTSQYPGASWNTLVAFGGTHSNAMGIAITLETNGSTIGNAYGVFSSHLSAGTVNNGYGVYVQQVAGTNKWAFYNNDASAPSYLAGRLGIGVTVPTASLHVNGTMRLVDGTEAAGKVLVSDASGNASWGQAMPSGAVSAYAGTAVPTGWLLCDGTPVSRTTYSLLFNAIGTAWGAGDGSTTFNLPDMRGLFLRGVDGAAGIDPDKASRFANNTGGNTGNNVGSEQSDQLQSHNHSISTLGSTISVLGGLATANTPGGSTSTNSTGGNETRPSNVYVYYIIKQ